MDEKTFDDELEEESKNIVNDFPTIFKYIDFDGGYKLLSDSKLRITNPSYFNDPYDCYEGLISLDNPEGFIHDLINEHYQHLNSDDKQKLKLHLNKPTYLTSVFEEVIKKDKDGRGIICFTQDPENLLMWSQYAKSHTGICIGFNLEKLYHYIKSPLNMEIKYKDEIAVLNAKYTEKFEPCNYFLYKKSSFINWLRTKADCWEYEKEIRIVFSSIEYEGEGDEEGYITISFDKKIIDSIYLGSRIKQQHESTLINELTDNYPNAKIYKMELSKASFNLVPIEIGKNVNRL